MAAQLTQRARARAANHELLDRAVQALMRVQRPQRQQAATSLVALPLTLTLTLTLTLPLTLPVFRRRPR